MTQKKVRLATNSVRPNTSSMRLETITPEMAKELLACNTGNFRRLNETKARQYALDMINGRWEITGDAISITDGVVLNGQHRLLGIVIANTPIETYVARNIATSAKMMDTGTGRTVAQWLHHLGHKDSTSAAAVAKLCIQHDKGFWGVSTLQQDKFSRSDIIDYAEAYREEIYNAIRFGARSHITGMPRTLAAALIHIGSGRVIQPEDNPVVSWFWGGMESGADLCEGDPPLTLRNRLIANKASAAKMTREYTRYITTIAWNKAVLGERVLTLRLRQVGPGRQDPPKEILMAPHFHKG